MQEDRENLTTAMAEFEAAATEYCKRQEAAQDRVMYWVVALAYGAGLIVLFTI